MCHFSKQSSVSNLKIASISISPICLAEEISQMSNLKNLTSKYSQTITFTQQTLLSQYT